MCVLVPGCMWTMWLSQSERYCCLSSHCAPWLPSTPGWENKISIRWTTSLISALQCFWLKIFNNTIYSYFWWEIKLHLWHEADLILEIKKHLWCLFYLDNDIVCLSQMFSKRLVSFSMWIDHTRWARNTWAMAAIFVLTMAVIADMVRLRDTLIQIHYIVCVRMSSHTIWLIYISCILSFLT